MRHVALLSTVLAMLVAPAVTEAQTATGQITGSVKDSSGAVMEKVKVVVTNEETGLTRETTTNADGAYVVPLLPVGSYVVTAEQSGFKIAITSGVRLNVDQIQRDRPAARCRQRQRDRGGAIGRRGPRHGEREHRPQHHREAGDGAAAQRPELPAAAVPRARAPSRPAASRAACGRAPATPSASWARGRRRTTSCSTGRPTPTRRSARRRRSSRSTRSRSSRSRRRPTRRSTASARTRSTSSARPGTNRLAGTVFGFFRNEALDARNFFDNRTAPQPELDQKQFGFVVGGPVMLPFYDGRNKTFFLANYEGTRIERGSSAFYIVPDARPARRPVHDDDHRSARPASRSPTTPSRQSRFSRLAQLALEEQLVSDAERQRRLKATIRPSGRCRRTRTSSRCAATRIWRLWAACSCATRRSTYENRTSSNLLEIGDRVFVQDTTNWQVSHTWPVRNNLVNQFRIGRVDARADQDGIPCPQADVDFLQRDRHVHGHARRPARVPEHRHDRVRGHGRRGQRLFSASNQPMWDLSNTTTWIERQPHAELRRQLPPVVAAARPRHGLPRQLRPSTVGFTGDRVADMLLGYYSESASSSRRPSACPAPPGNPREFNFKYFAPYFQDDWRVSSTLTVNMGLRWDYRNVPVRNAQTAWPGGTWTTRLAVCSSRTSRSSTGASSDGGYYQVRGPAQSREPRPIQGVRTAPRVRVPALRRRDGGARRLRRVLRLGRGPRDRRRRRHLSVREPRQLHPVGRADDAAADDRRALPELRRARSRDARRQHVPRRQPVAGAEQPLRAAVVARRAARAVREHDARAELHRHQGDQPADAAQHRAGAALRSRPTPVGGATASRSRTSSSTSTATGAGDRTTTRSTPSSSTAAAARC